ncbi:MAG: 4-(cytidine 5'-diphospho)-2-C-methyl-D-erythritol kinase [Armatimonadota bacterium]|nr:4-(cytidine 5'-diphospho)-2-C-methyl-D-erythritol kinase [Armatimonadota bacterium]
MTERRLQLLSPAKVNLTLEVGGLRPDGYHEIDSVVQVIDLADTLEVEAAPPGVMELVVKGADVPCGSENLVIRAAAAFFEVTGVEGGARFHLTKRIPIRAGLGGGSSNAAATILALNSLYETALPKSSLSSLAARVSSDAPLFIYGGTLRTTGRGEIVSELPDAPELHLVIIKPQCGVSTHWAYQQLHETPRCELGYWSCRAEVAVRAGDVQQLTECLHNDFDAVITAQFPEIYEAERALLNAGALRSILCGSGSAVFGLFKSGEEAARAADTLTGGSSHVFLSRTLTRAESIELMTPK